MTTPISTPLHQLFTKLGQYWQVFWLFRQLHLQRTLQYRLNFWFWAFVSIMWTFFNFFFFGLIVNVSGQIGGWNLAEMYVLLSVFTILDSLIWSFLYHNMTTYTQMVFNGELGGLLLKPVDPMFYLMTQQNSYTNVFRFFLGLGMLLWSLNQLHIQPTLVTLVLFTIVMICAILFIYFVWFGLSTFAFWVEKLDNINEVIPNLRRMWEVPRSVFTGILSTVLTVIIPLNLVTSLPSEVLIGRASWQWIGYFFLSTLVVFWVSRQFFNFSIRRFTGVAN